MTKHSLLWGWVAGLSAMVVLVGCAGTERIPAGKSLYDRLGGKSSFPQSLNSLCQMWLPTPGSMADLRRPIFGNSRATSSIKFAWRQEDPAPTVGAT